MAPLSPILEGAAPLPARACQLRPVMGPAGIRITSTAYGLEMPFACSCQPALDRAATATPQVPSRRDERRLSLFASVPVLEHASQKPCN